MEELKRFRNSVNMTVDEFSKAIGISKSLYEKVESGNRHPSRNFTEKFKKAFPQFDVNIFFS